MPDRPFVGVGDPRMAEVGGMDPVDRGFRVVSLVEDRPVEIGDAAAVSLFRLAPRPEPAVVEGAMPDPIGVVLVHRERRTGDEQDRQRRIRKAKLRDEVREPLREQVRGSGVGLGVDRQKRKPPSRPEDRGRRPFAIRRAGESEVQKLAVEPPREDVRERHPRPADATALNDARAVYGDPAVTGERVGDDARAVVDAEVDVDGRGVQRQVQHIAPHPAVRKAAEVGFVRRRGPGNPGDVEQTECPVFLVETVQVDAALAHGAHGLHRRRRLERDADADRPRIGRELRLDPGARPRMPGGVAVLPFQPVPLRDRQPAETRFVERVRTDQKKPARILQ